MKFAHILCRENCILRDKVYIKDLRIINRRLERCIAVDNSIVAFMGNLDNLLHVKSFTGENNDCELMELLSIVADISSNDLREQIKDKNLFRYMLDMENSK